MKRALLFVVCLVLVPSVASAQEPTPTPIPLLVPEIGGVEGAAVRSFTVTGVRIAEPISIGVEVVHFDEAEAASNALDTIQERQFARLAQGGDVSGIKQASADKIGDETRAFGGPLVLADAEAPIDEFAIGLVFVRRDAFLFITLVGSIAGDSVGPALELTRTIVDRQPGGDSTPVGSDGMHSGGLWDMLPTLADVPEGMIFDEDRVPVPFEPLPGQDAEAVQSTESESSAPNVETVPIGSPASIADTWSITVLRVFEDPHDIDPDADWFNDWLDQYPAPDRQEYLAIRVRIENIGNEAAEPYLDLSFSLVSATGFEYDRGSYCGNIPGGLAFDAQMDAGDSIEANLCWVVQTRHLPSLRLKAEPTFSFDGADAAWLSISQGNTESAS